MTSPARVSIRAISIYLVVLTSMVIGGILSGLSITALICLIIFTLCIFLIATEMLIRSTAALFGAFLVLIVFVIAGSYTPSEIVHSYVEVDTILTLFGIIIVASLGLKSGLFYFIGMKIAKASKGDPIVLYFTLALFTFVLNIILITVAAIVVVVSLTLAICDILKIDPRPYVIMEIFIANVSSPAVMISSVPNIVIAEKAPLSYSFFIVNLLPFSIIFFPISIWMLYSLFQPPTVVDLRRAMAIQEIDEWLFVKNKKEFYVSGLCITGLIVGFIVWRELMVISILFAVISMIFYSNPDALLHDVDWDTLIFFVGFYIVVAGLSLTGILDSIADGLLRVSRGNIYTLITLLFWISVILSGFVDNIPYVLVIIPIIKILVSTSSFAQFESILWISLILACNIGGGLNPYASPQNLLALSMAKRAKYPIMSRDFYKVSIKWTIIGSILAYIYLMVFLITPIAMSRIGPAKYILLLTTSIAITTIICLHKAVGLRRSWRYLRVAISTLSVSVRRLKRKLLASVSR